MKAYAVQLQEENDRLRAEYRMLEDAAANLEADILRLRGLLREVVADDELSLARGDYGMESGLRLTIDAALTGEKP